MHGRTGIFFAFPSASVSSLLFGGRRAAAMSDNAVVKPKPSAELSPSSSVLPTQGPTSKVDIHFDPQVPVAFSSLRVLPPPSASPTQSTHCTLLSTTVWLQRLHLARYAPNFRALTTVVALAAAVYPAEKHGPSALLHAENILKDRYAVSALGARKKIASALQQWAPRPRPAASDTPAPAKPESRLISNEKIIPSDLEPEKKEDPFPKKRPLWPIFSPGYVPPGDRPGAKRRKAESALLTKPKSGQRLFRTPGGSASKPNGTGKPAPKKPRSGGWGGGSTYHRMCHRVPGTSFTVDSFQVRNEVEHFGKKKFLSHFHSDHYGGLTKTSLEPGAKVLCSPVTAGLVRMLLGLPADRLLELPLCQAVDVPCASGGGRGATVWLYDANHCPGAAVLLFRVWATGEYVLHCGDCRFDRAVFESHAELRRVIESRALSTLYLDTTYASPEHCFPSQGEVLAEVTRAAQYENTRTRGRCIFFVGAYTIGKEKVFLAIAEAIDALIFADARKRRILRALRFGPRLEDRIAERAGDARVHVVPMRALGADGLREYVRKSALDTGFVGRGLAIAVKPTGWTFKPGERACVRRRSRHVDQAVTYDVPYSEHSSFSELREFVAWARPRRIVPTVGFSTPEKARELAKMLGHQVPEGRSAETSSRT